MNTNFRDSQKSHPNQSIPFRGENQLPSPLGERNAADDDMSASEATAQSEITPVKQAAKDLRDTGIETLQSAKEAGSGFLKENKEKLASCIDEYVGDIHTACEGLKREEKTALASPAEKVATQLQRTADYLRKSEPIAIYHDVENFVRRRPELVYSALFVTGLVALRFLKASARNPQSA